MMKPMPSSAVSRNRIASSCAALIAALTLANGCATIVWEVGKAGVQHTVGAKLGPCDPSKDSVALVRGQPWRRASSDEEDTGSGEQRFWHEWAYRHPHAEEKLGRDSVIVVGYLWGSGVHGCDVRERRARTPGRDGLPWEGFGDVPGAR